MQTFNALQPRVRAYVAFVVLCGAAAIALSVQGLFSEPIGSQWLILAALTILTGSFSVKVSSINAYISVSETFVFASVLLFGTSAGTITVLLECLVIILWMKPQGRPLHRMLFNLAAPSVAIWVAGTAFYLLSGIEPYSQQATALPRLFFPLLAFTTLYFLLNSWLVAIAVGLENRRSVPQIWWKNFAWLSVNYFSGASVAALIVTYTRTLEISTLIVIVPLLVVSYLTFRTAMGRAEDSYSHLSELNKLYLSTIETLAMAIDAKDQITHGHIRRVQSFAVGLAKRIGVADEHLLKAIEAAALLHDMGKLAIPEHILNKPGKLTPAEFERMKLHASIGADLLSVISFPYPVVPIVRHHHENWDGSGYPTGLRGTDIPIGARILSVVDCFDALTSDRPYRPRLSDSEALTILLDRRGSMYDPLIVDTFIRVYREISPANVENEDSSNAIVQRFGKAHAEPIVERVDESSIDALLDLELRRSLDDVTDFGDLTHVLTSVVRRYVPFRIGIIYLYDIETDGLVARHVVGDPHRVIKDFRVSLGERMSGWVAAQRRSIVNADAKLDLGELAHRLSPSMKASIGVPLVSNERLLGVLALYSESDFDPKQHSYVESAANLLSSKIESLGSIRSPADPLTGLPVSTNLAASIRETHHGDARVAIVIANVSSLGEINRSFGRDVGDQVLLHVANNIKTALPSGGLLFRHSQGDFVACVIGASESAMLALPRDLRRVLRSNPFFGGDGHRHDVQVALHTFEIGKVSSAVQIEEWLQALGAS